MRSGVPRELEMLNGPCLGVWEIVRFQSGKEMCEVSEGFMMPSIFYNRHRHWGVRDHFIGDRHRKIYKAPSHLVSPGGGRGDDSVVYPADLFDFENHFVTVSQKAELL